MPTTPRIDPELDRRTWRDRTGRRGEDLRRVFGWLEAADPAVWWDPKTVGRALGVSRRRVEAAAEVLVGELALERAITAPARARRYRVLTW
jgi:hypothetical protein